MDDGERYYDGFLPAFLSWVHRNGGIMDAMKTILKSRQASIAKLRKAIDSLESLLANSQSAAKDVLTSEISVRQARLARLVLEAQALEKEIERLNPVLPGTEAKPKK